MPQVLPIQFTNAGARRLASGVQVPADASGVLVLTGQINATDRVDVRNSVTCEIERSVDGVNWLPWLAFTWQGNTKTDKQGNPAGDPTVRLNVGEVAGQWVRASITTARRFRIGFDVSWA